MEHVELRLRLEDEQELAAAMEVAEQEPEVTAEVQAPETEPGAEVLVEPVTAMLIGAGVLAAAKFLMDWWQKVRGGLVIDQRPGAKDDIYRDRDVPWGYVVVYPADGGEVKVEVKDAPKDAAERWISEVISGAYKTVADLVKATKEALPKAEVA